MAKYDHEKLYIVIDEEYRDTFEYIVNEFLAKGYLQDALKSKAVYIHHNILSDAS